MTTTKKLIITILLSIATINAAVIDGTITDGSNDELLSGVSVVLIYSSGQGASDELTGDTAASMVTTAEGTFEFTDLVPRRYNIIASLSGYSPASTNARLWEEDETSTKDIQLTASDNSGQIDVTVTSANGDEPVDGATVILIQQLSSVRTPLDTAATNAQGECSFTNVATSVNLLVSVSADGFDDASSDAVSLEADATETITISLDEYVAPSSIISGVITKEGSEEPVADAVVVLRSGTRVQGQGITWEDFAETSTDAEGAYSFEELNESSDNLRYTIVVTKEGYSTYTSENITVEDGTNVTDIVMSLISNGNLHIYVGRADSSSDNYPDGLPIADAAVSAALEVPDGEIYSGTTDDNGWVSFENALTGNYTITVYKDGWVTETQGRALEEDEDDTTTVLLEPVENSDSKTLTGTITDSDGEPVDGAEIVLQAGGNNNVLTMTAASGSDGDYTIQGIPSQYNSVRISITLDGFEEFNETVAIDGESATFDLSLTPSDNTVANPEGDYAPKISFNAGSRSLKLLNLNDSYRLSVIDLRGRIISSQTVSPGNNSVILRSISAGSILLVEIKNSSKSLRWKLLAQ